MFGRNESLKLQSSQTETRQGLNHSFFVFFVSSLRISLANVCDFFVFMQNTVRWEHLEFAPLQETCRYETWNYASVLEHCNFFCHAWYNTHCLVGYYIKMICKVTCLLRNFEHKATFSPLDPRTPITTDSHKLLSVVFTVTYRISSNCE